MELKSKKDYSMFKGINVYTDLPIDIHIGNAKNVKHIISTQLEEYGITTLDQLFIAYDEGIFDDLRKTGHKTIKGLIEILKNVYLGEPLVVDAIIDNQVTGLTALLRFGFTEDELFELVSVTGNMQDKSIMSIFNEYLKRTNNSVPKTGLRKNLIFKITTILSSLEDDKEKDETDKVVIEQLKRQIEVLEDRRHSLDMQIFSLKATLLEFEEKGKGQK